MSAPNPRLVETGTTTTLAEFDFGELTGPVESTVKTFDYLNDGAAAETITEAAIGVEESDDAGVTWHSEGPITTGRWLQVCATGQSGTGITPQTTSYTPVGVGARLYLDPIPADCRRANSAKLVVPAGHSTASKKLRIIAYRSEAVTPLPQGLFESGKRGVLSGTNDATRSYLMQGGTLAETGTPDGNVQITDTTIWHAEGVPHVRYAGAVAIAASASGKARWVTLSLGATGTPTQTASAEVTAPAPVGDRPAVPSGEAFLGYVHRDDGTIVNADIYQGDVLRSPFYLSTNGLNFTIGPGLALVDNALLRKDFSQTGTLADAQTSVLYLARSDGSVLQVVSGDLPGELRAEPIWEVTAAGGVVTASRDLRNFLGPRLHTFSAFFAGAAADDTAIYWTAPLHVGLYVALPRGVLLSVPSSAMMGDRTAGELRVPLEWWNGSTWVSLFSSTTKEPQLAYNATALTVGDFAPDTVAVAAGTRLRFRQETTSLTGGTTNPSNVFVSVDFEEARP